ncbi:nicotinate-nucleotide--dimethylbenzimidazole phosphoribosyltransferase [Pleionea sediminis]|uniref:nicotinate-nucleotide--dimethylbenzimidazole phosphoribosyltransferase n=1 Tax=Pleionea sediminis TaxID=2569479 RepID=UPI00197C20D2|nr:nicotinate-nucleotide--dimethylbenzimidazole phosphoribosyltransferase [Pleionea sediminis]
MITPTTFNIKKLDKTFIKKIESKINNKTKPPGSLGRIELLASQLALILGYDEIQINQPTMLVFAADHGIAEEGISIAPSEVTQQMVLNFLNGGAAINCFCRTNEMNFKVIDAGIKNPVNHEKLIQQSMGLGTHNFTTQQAMTVQQASEAILLGRNITNECIDQGSNLLGFGEMGIGNTSAAAAIMAAVLKIPADECVGRGTGISDDALNKKLECIERALRIHADKLDCPLDILASVGGFEIAQMAGAMLAAAERSKVILVDGFISTAAALIAHQIAPEIKDYMIFCHQSNEQGHQRMLNHLDGKALLSLDMRLGEGTGCALALPLIRSAASFYNEMASFDTAGINPV